VCACVCVRERETEWVGGRKREKDTVREREVSAVPVHSVDSFQVLLRLETGRERGHGEREAGVRGRRRERVRGRERDNL